MPAFPDFLRIGTSMSLEDHIINVAADGTPIYTWEMQLIFLFSQFLKFNYTLVVADDGASGELLPSGNWTGIAGLFQQGLIDLSFDQEGMSSNKTKVLDYSYPYYSSRLTFMTQKPRPVQKSWNIFHPFSGTVWGTLALFIIMFSLLFYAMNRGQRNYVATFFQTLKSCLSQSFDNLRLSSISQRFLYGGWILGTAVLIYGYNSVLLNSLLAIPTKGIRTIPELASAVADGSVKCRTYKGSYFIKEFMESEIESHRIIGKALFENSQEEEIPKMYTDPNSAQITSFVTSEEDLEFFENDFFISEDSFRLEWYAISMRKKFCCKKKINEMVKRMIYGGLFDKIKNDKNLRDRIIMEGLNPSPSPTENVKIKFGDLKAAFIVLIMGHSLSFLVFVGEIVYHKISQRSAQNRNRPRRRRNRRPQLTRLSWMTRFLNWLRRM